MRALIEFVFMLKQMLYEKGAFAFTLYYSNTRRLTAAENMTQKKKELNKCLKHKSIKEKLKIILKI